MNKLTTCKTCGTEISTQSSKCPKCGAYRLTGSVVGVIIIASIVIVMFLFPFLRSDNASTTGLKIGSSANVSPSNLWDGKFEFKNIDFTGSGFSDKITGSMINRTNKQYSYIQIEFNLYDKSGAQIGSTMTNINNLEAGGTWKFEAMLLKDNVASVKVKNVTGW